VKKRLLSIVLLLPLLTSAQTLVNNNSSVSSFPQVTVRSELSSAVIPLWKIKYDSAQLYWKKDIQTTIKLLSEAEQIAFDDLGIYDENYFSILSELGLAYSEDKNYSKAQQNLRKNIKLQQEFFGFNDPRLLKPKCNLATVLLKAGQDSEAKSIYKEIIGTYAAMDLAGIYLVASENLVQLYEIHEQYDSALIIARIAMKMVFNASNIQQLRLAEGRILRKERHYADASATLVYLENELLTDPSTPDAILNSVKVQLSLINIEMRLFVKAETDLLKLYRDIKGSANMDEALLTEVTNGLGYIYEKLGIYDKALIYYRESLNRCVKSYGYNSLSCVIMQNNIAGVYLKQGFVKEAINEYEGFLSTFKNVSQEDNKTYLTSLNNLATAYRQNGQYAIALKHLNELYTILEKKNLLGGDLAASVINNIAVTATLKGDYAQAVTNFERVLKIKESVFGIDSPALLDVMNNLAITYWLIDKHSYALPLFKRALDLSIKEIKYIFPSLTPAEQVQFYQQQKQNFERFNTLSIQSAETQPELLIHMFNNQLLLKSLVFFTNKRRGVVIDTKDNEHLNSLVALADTKRAQLGQYYQMPYAQLKGQNISVKRMEYQVDSLEKSIRHTVHAESQEQVYFQWNDIQRSLQGNEALIEIVRFRKYDAFVNKSEIIAKQVSIGFTDSVHYAALITTIETKEHPKLVLLRNGNQLEKRYLAYYGNTIKFDIDDTISYGQYVRPWEQAIKGKTKIYISADGVYHQINLNAIHNIQGTFFLEKYDVHLIMNAAQLVNRKPETSIDFSKMVVFGNPAFGSPLSEIAEEAVLPKDIYDPLPGTLEEVKGIGSIFKISLTSKNIFMNRAASETNFRLISSPSILHIATHGFFSTNVIYLNEHVKDDFMFHSGILLAPSQPSSGQSISDNDGIITAYDVMNMDLATTDLVVISACETGLGKIESSEGVHGLQRAFLQAGSRDIMVSLWKVEDVMTKNLMVKFYSYMSKNHSSRESFRLAQLDQLKEIRNPRQWAGFIMVSGD